MRREKGERERVRERERQEEVDHEAGRGQKNSSFSFGALCYCKIKLNEPEKLCIRVRIHEKRQACAIWGKRRRGREVEVVGKTELKKKQRPRSTDKALFRRRRATLLQATRKFESAFPHEIWLIGTSAMNIMQWNGLLSLRWGGS